jgi:transposase
MLLAEGPLPECWIPPARILECRTLLETYHDLRAEHTAWVQRIHAVLPIRLPTWPHDYTHTDRA